MATKVRRCDSRDRMRLYGGVDSGFLLRRLGDRAFWKRTLFVAVGSWWLIVQQVGPAASEGIAVAGNTTPESYYGPGDSTGASI